MSTTLPDKYRAVNIDDIVEIRPDVNADSAYPKQTISKVFRQVTKERGDAVALVSCKGVKYSWKDYYDNAHKFARALVSIGMKPFDTVSIIGFNSPEYMFSILGAMEAGGVAAGIYTTNGEDACYYVLNHCNSTVIVVDGEAQLKKILQIRSKLPNLKMIVVYNANDSLKLPEDEPNVARVRYWVDFLSMGDASVDAEIDQRVANQKPGQCASLIYTSGTTGNPKAVMISHDNACFICQVILKDFNIGMQDRIVSFLPLSHIAAQMIDVFAATILGMQVYYAQPDALKGSLLHTLKTAHPTIFVSVPRVFEKMMDKVSATIEQTKGIKRWIVDFCRKKGTIYSNNCQAGTKKQKLRCYGLAKKLLLNKIRLAMGLDQTRLLYSAAAPIDVAVVNFFASFGIPLYEIFGMSECAGPATFHTFDKWKVGTAGPAMRGTIMKSVPGTREIILYGRHIFMGYLKMPEETLRTIDNDGFLHSGDCGECDSDGYWKVTGRIKELIITAGGENIPPVLIETELKRLAPALSNVVLIGDKRKYLSVLLTLQCRVSNEGDGQEGELVGDAIQLAMDLGSEARTVKEAAEDPKFIDYFNDVISQYNEKAFSNAQKIQKFSILHRDFSINTGELTPTLKMKRGYISSLYANEIEKMYS